MPSPFISSIPLAHLDKDKDVVQSTLYGLLTLQQSFGPALERLDQKVFNFVYTVELESYSLMSSTKLSMYDFLKSLYVLIYFSLHVFLGANFYQGISKKKKNFYQGQLILETPMNKDVNCCDQRESCSQETE